MAKKAASATKGKRKVAKVMKEHKKGALKSGSGKKVASRKQAVAIALSEAGASKSESPQKNREHLKKTKEKERRGETAQAQKEGRSKH